MNNDDIEILNFDDDEIDTNKKKKINKKVIYEEHVPIKKKKKKMRIGEKIFLTISILFILGCIVFYGYRTYHYYHLTHDKVNNITLKEKLTTLNNITYQDDGLYEKSGYFYYKGINVDNYVYYSGRTFRIIDISDGIRMIDDETNTNIVWSVESNYEKSYIHEWLNSYLKTLKDYDLYLKENDWCNKSVDIENYDCTNTINDYVGLLSTEDYLQAGGKNSYLNNKTYYWTINQDNEGKVFYVNNEGSINNISKKDEMYFSYGIRPVITLKEDVSVIAGDGSVDKPFIIEELGNAMLKYNSVGSFVKYNNDSFRVLSIDSDGISLIYDGVLDNEIKYTEVYKYLNNEFIKRFNKDDLVKRDYYVNEYSYGNKYLGDNNDKRSEYITIPSIKDMFLNEYDGYWLNDYSDKKLGLYYMIDENKMFFSDLSTNVHKIRPIIKVDLETVVISGIGTKLIH